MLFAKRPSSPPHSLNKNLSLNVLIENEKLLFGGKFTLFVFMFLKKITVNKNINKSLSFKKFSLLTSCGPSSFQHFWNLYCTTDMYKVFHQNESSYDKLNYWFGQRFCRMKNTHVVFLHCAFSNDFSM